MGRKEKKQSVISFLSQHFTGFHSMVGIMLAVAFLCLISKVASPILTQVLVDNVLSGLNPEWGQSLILIYAGVVLFELLLRIPEVMTWRQRMAMIVSSKSEFFWHALRLPVSYYSDKYAGDIAARINYSGQIVTILNRIFLLGGDVFLIAIYLYFMIKYSLFLSVFAIINIVVNLLLVKYVHKKQVRSNKAMQKGADQLQGFTSSGIANIEAIKGSSGEKYFFNKWAEKLAGMQNAAVECTSRNIRLASIPLLFQAVSDALVLGFGAWYIMRGYLTVGMLMTFQSFMSATMKPLGHVIEIGQMTTSVKVKTERMSEVLDEECDVPDNLESVEGIEEDKLMGEVELRNVTFGYDRSQPPIIRNFNLHLNPGERVAFVGGSGSGKSTLANLISGMYKPWSGEVLFDGKPLSEINREVFANSVSIIDQNIVLFDGSIADNIKMWDSSIEDFAMIFACHEAHIHNDITIRKGAYSSPLESGGKNFSGGQRQRLELATAFAKEPSLIVMDEGTSALDAVTEDIVMTNLRNMGSSLIIIAHRLSTIRDCDEIIVLDKGAVVERGTHDELIRNKSYYSKLVEN